MDNLGVLHKATVDLLCAAIADYGLKRPTEVNDSIIDANNKHGSDLEIQKRSLRPLADESFKSMMEVFRQEDEVVKLGCLDAVTDVEEVQSLRECLKRVRVLKENHDKCIQMLNALLSNYELITERTSSLHDACDRMMANQTELAAGSEELHAALHYYTQYDRIIKYLGSQKISVTGQVFTQILSTIVECLTFLHQHPGHKDAAAYIEKYEYCLSRAIAVIRVNVMADLEASIQAVRDHQCQLQLEDYANPYADDDTFALLYGVFAVRAGAVKTAIGVAESHFKGVTEFESMVADCYQTYFSIRNQLLSPAIEKTIDRLLSQHKNSSCALTRSGCTFLLRLCDDEYRLFNQFFITEGVSSSSLSASPVFRTKEFGQSSAAFTSSAMSSFDEFIESICRMFYDVLRPIIIHNTHLETLSELCNILKIEMIEERCGLMMSLISDKLKDSNVSNEENGPVTCISPSFNPRNGFIRVMSELVGDIAERIVHRTAIYCESDIANYHPSEGDLAYPEKLIMIKNIENETSASNKDEKSSNGKPIPSTSAVDLHCLWYPTVRRTVVCLSKLYKCVDHGVFQSLARDLLSTCCESLERASDQIKTRNRENQTRDQRALDGELFVIKHLLILREQTSPYRIIPASCLHCGHLNGEPVVQRDYSFDLSKIKASATNLFSDRQRWFELNSNNAFLEFLLQVPISVSEHSGDSRRIIDIHLKKHCNILIKAAAGMVVSELSGFMDKVEQLSNASEFNVRDSEITKCESMNNYVSQAYRRLVKFWPEILSTFNMYIGVRDTEEVLLQPVRRRIVEEFSRCCKFVEKNFDDEERQIAGVPSTEQVWLVLTA
ncbi:hypothetical protein AB6A40_001637 [Gnathostoma spinigerum]|uniref:Conserved oligomeric Golgi complex subunit 3 n=1 Tax=Gnathostoma spinigerum TaxID=75299 RepID=A0ABD6E4S4_9BILA